MPPVKCATAINQIGIRMPCRKFVFGEEVIMQKDSDLEGHQDQGGKSGGQTGMPKPEPGPDAEPQKGEVVGDPRTKPDKHNGR